MARLDATTGDGGRGDTTLDALRSERTRLQAQVRRLTAAERRYLLPNPASARVLAQARARLRDVERTIAEAHTSAGLS